MFKGLISTIAICAILQSIINIIAPESKIKGTLLTTTNIIFMTTILFQIIEIIKNLL